MSATAGPYELRVKWIADDEPYDPGDTDHCEDHSAFTAGCQTCETYRREVKHYVNLHGVYGCVVETRAPACACCGCADWEHAGSLWGVVGDSDYHREVERDLIGAPS